MKKISAEGFERMETIWEGLSKTAHTISDTFVMHTYPEYEIGKILNNIGYAQDAFHKVLLYATYCRNSSACESALTFSEAKEYYKKALNYIKKDLTTISILRTADFVEPDVREVMNAVWKNINTVIINMDSDTYFN